MRADYYDASKEYEDAKAQNPQGPHNNWSIPLKTSNGVTLLDAEMTLGFGKYPNQDLKFYFTADMGKFDRDLCLEIFVDMAKRMPKHAEKYWLSMESQNLR